MIKAFSCGNDISKTSPCVKVFTGHDKHYKLQDEEGAHKDG